MSNEKAVKAMLPFLKKEYSMPQDEATELANDLAKILERAGLFPMAEPPMYSVVIAEDGCAYQRDQDGWTDGCEYYSWQELLAVKWEKCSLASHQAPPAKFQVVYTPVVANNEH